MLQHGFFQVEPFNPYPYWNGHVFFESNTPGNYSVNIPYKVKCGIICVGGGMGGFCAKTSIIVDGASFTGLVAFSGASGGYSFAEHTFDAGSNIIISVGKGGDGYSSTSLYGSISKSNPTLQISGVEGTQSRVIVGSSLILFANSGTDGKLYFTDPNNPNTAVGQPSSGGTGATKNGNDGDSTGKGTDVNLAGGASVYSGHGAGGSAGFSGNNQSGSPWANNGASGYVKIYAIMPS